MLTNCLSCGKALPAEIAAQAAFCPFCGATLSAETTTSMAAVRDDIDDSLGLSDADRAAVEALPVDSALLLLFRGPHSEERFLLDAELLVAGRHPSSDIFLDDITVSRRHVEFTRAENGFSVKDLGSLNGTYVNRDRIDSVVLTNGDEVQIGKFRLVYYASTRGFTGAAQ